MKIVILCGGKGMRLREETDVKPKPMIRIGDMPILWHIMKIYASHGFTEFILCLGYKGEVIKDFFYNYEMLTNDFTIELGTKNIEIYPQHQEQGWKITLADTGNEAMTGARVKRVQKYITDDEFMLTYGDGVTDLDITKVLEYHRAHGKIGTVTAVSPQSQYGELKIKGDQVVSFAEKPDTKTNSISGGYFVFNRKFFDYLTDDDSCVLERQALEKLTTDGELKVYSHDGFWQSMDTFRDYQFLQNLWNNNPPWKKW